MRTRRAMLVALVVAAPIAMAGCSGIPTSGPLHQGDAIGLARDVGDEPGTRVLPQPPRPGSSQQQIIEGFLNASASFENDHAVARQFLTADAAKTWNPAAGARIYDSSAAGNDSYKVVGATDVVFSAKMTGTIGVQGEYNDASDDLVIDFKMRKVDTVAGPGQWRIATPPTGLLLTPADVDRVYRTYDIYFPDPGRNGLVPDQVLLPIGPGPSTSTALMRALVTGPTPWLAPAVQTAIPTGTKLVVDSAPIVNGVVQVDLTAPAATANSQEAAALSAQIVWTLRAVGQVTAVRITVQGVPLRGVPAVQSIDSWPLQGPDAALTTVTSRAFFATKDRLVSLTDNRPQALPGPAGNGTFPLRYPGVSFDETHVAGLDPNRHRMYVVGITAADATDPSGKVPTAAITGAVQLTAPTWDRTGNVWTVDQRARESVVWVVGTGAPGGTAGPAKQVQTQDLPAGRVLAMRISRDGARVVIVVQPTGETTGQTYIGRVERGAGKLALSGFKPIRTVLSDVTDVSWVTADRLLLLGRTTSPTLQPLIVDLMGNSKRALGPIDASAVSKQSIASITAALNHDVLASTSDGQLYRYLATGWEPLGKGTDPAYPG